MKTMIEVAHNYLQTVDSETFDKLWKEVVKELKLQWKQELKRVLLKDIQAKKIGEFYTLLTVSGDFIRTTDARWALVSKFTSDEIRQIRINSSEQLD